LISASTRWPGCCAAIGDKSGRGHAYERIGKEVAAEKDQHGAGGFFDALAQAVVDPEAERQSQLGNDECLDGDDRDDDGRCGQIGAVTDNASPVRARPRALASRRAFVISSLSLSSWSLVHQR
jgi:hypothetical protein